MGAVWSALLVGGCVAGALFLRLLRSDSPDPEPLRGALPGEAPVPGGKPDGGGGGGLSPRPPKQELLTKPENLQESNEHLISSSKCLDNLQEATDAQQNLCGADRDNARQYWPTAQILDTYLLTETGNSAGYSEPLRNKNLESHGEEWSFQKQQVKPASTATCFRKKLSSGQNLPMDRVKGVSHSQLDSQVLADQENWEVVSRHSSWGDIGLGGSVESSGLNLSEGMNCGSTSVESKVWEADGKVRSSESQQVSIGFQVHYITSTGAQFLAVTGDHESLGEWKTYIPLHDHKDGFWSHSLFLPADTVVEWKFVLVENGEVARWEECSNRLLETGHEDKVIHRWWGVH